MPADPTSANSDDLSKLCLPMTASAQANGACDRAVRAFPRASTRPFAHPRDPSPSKWAGQGLDSELRTVGFPAPRHRRKS